MTTLAYLHWGLIEQEKVEISATTQEACEIPSQTPMYASGAKKVLTTRGTTLKRKGSILRP